MTGLQGEPGYVDELQPVRRGHDAHPPAPDLRERHQPPDVAGRWRAADEGIQDAGSTPRLGVGAARAKAHAPTPMFWASSAIDGGGVPRLRRSTSLSTSLAIGRQ